MVKVFVSPSIQKEEPDFSLLVCFETVPRLYYNMQFFYFPKGPLVFKIFVHLFQIT